MNRRRNDKVNRITNLEDGTRRAASNAVRRTNCDLLIDGYNLLHVTRFKPANNREGELRRCRDGLLSMLAKYLPPERYRRITIVFDSEGAPRHLPDQLQWQHLQVIFARAENSADDLIASLIQRHANPRNLIVISSDHRVQVAAQRKRGTTWIDSDPWIEAVLDHAEDQSDAGDADAPEPAAANSDLDDSMPMSAAELEEFRQAMKADDGYQKPDDLRDDLPQAAEADEVFENPFPEGYFDDLEDL